MTIAKTIRDGGSAAPPQFIVPFLRHRAFVGREEDLARIHELLQKGEAVGVRPVEAVGLGGIGKTQIAVEYAYRHEDDYPGGVYWVNAARDVQVEMAALAEKVGLFEDDAPDAERQHRRVLALVRFLDARPDALVIFDNVEDPGSLRRGAFGFIPAQLTCRVLFTTRQRDESGAFASVRVGALSEEEALKVLAAEPSQDGSTREAARVVCRMLGYLPLALALAGAYLRQNPEITLDDYRVRLREEGALASVDATGVGDDDLPTRHKASVEATLAIEWKLLAKVADGRRVLQAAALLGEAAEVPLARLALLTGLAATSVKTGHAAPLKAVLRKLKELSLLEMLGERAIRLHPLVREFAERRIEGREGFAAECAGNLGEALWDLGRLNDEVAARGVYAVIDDLREGVRLSREGEAGWIERLMKPLGREAHRLRNWTSAERPEFLLQQMRNQCFEMGEEDGCRLAEDVLVKRGYPCFQERVRSVRESEALALTLERHRYSVLGVAVTACGRWAVSASQDQTLKVWDLGSGQLLRTLKGHTHQVTGVAVTADGRWAVSTSMDETLKVWDLGSGQLVRTLEGHTNSVYGVVVTADGRRAVSASKDKTLKVWDLGSGQLVRTLEGHGDAVVGVAVTANGRRAVSASWDGALKVWDLGNGQLLRTLEGNGDAVSCVAVTADGRWAVSAPADGRWAGPASKDETLKVWDLGSGQLVRTLEGHTAG